LIASSYLVDTSVLSALAPDRPSLEPRVAQWFRDHKDRLYLSAITIAEIEQGVSKLRRAGGIERAGRLNDWLEGVMAAYADRILAIDARVGRLAGALSDQALAQGRHPGFPDVAITATALAHGLILLTRNGRHFEPLGVQAVDPLLDLPAE